MGSIVREYYGTSGIVRFNTFLRELRPHFLWELDPSDQEWGSETKCRYAPIALETWNPIQSMVGTPLGRVKVGSHGTRSLPYKAEMWCLIEPISEQARDLLLEVVAEADAIVSATFPPDPPCLAQYLGTPYDGGWSVYHPRRPEPLPPVWNARQAAEIRIRGEREERERTRYRAGTSFP